MQIKITSCAIVSLAGGGLGKVEKEEHQGETEVNRLLSHLQGTILGWTMRIDWGSEGEKSFKARYWELTGGNLDASQKFAFYCKMNRSQLIAVFDNSKAFIEKNNEPV